MSDKFANEIAVLLTTDTKPVVTFAWVNAGDLRRARSVFSRTKKEPFDAG